MTQDLTADKAAALLASCDQLRAFVLDAARNGLTFHDFESGLWQRLLLLGHQAAASFLQQQGTGDLGEVLTLPDGKTLQRLQGQRRRDLTSVFGTFTLQRTCYGSRQGQKIDFVPLDNRLDLPLGKFSYLLTDFDSLLSTELPFGQVKNVLQRILLLEQHVDSLERLGRQMAEHAEPFRQAQPTPAAQEAPILVRSADAKGVVMRQSAEAPPICDLAHKRGPKTGRKKQAILGAVYTVAPLPRQAEEIVEALFSKPSEQQPRAKRPEPCNKRVMARLNEYQDKAGVKQDGMAEVFAWMGQQTQERNPFGDKEVVNLMDGDERLWDSLEEVKEAGETDIVDLLHVMQRLWAVAGLYWPLASVEAEVQVKEWLLDILRGKIKEVLEKMRKQGEAAGLEGSKKKELELAYNYLEKRQEQMRYDKYLEKGYPIASGVIEGACRHYVKDRMERTGMSWTQAGAQAMLELRSQALNGDWDEFQDFFRLRQSGLLYPHRQLLESVAWPLAL